MKASECVLTMLWAFDARDQRRVEVRNLAHRVEQLENDLESAQHHIKRLESQVAALTDPLVLEQIRRPPPPIVVKVVERDLIQEGRDL